jgi:DNA-binding SARP family transcriptional activator
VQYRLLGPLEVHDGDRTVAIGGGRRRSLLALLLIHANELLSAERLIDHLWGERPTPTAAKSLQVHVSALRKRLGGGEEGPLLTRGHGYLLRVDAEDVDSLRFEQWLEEGNRLLAAGDAPRAATRLDEALALWRGPPLAGLEYEPFAQQEIARLEEHRLVALESRAEARLALGEHTRLVGELASLVRAHPLRERFRAQLMLALYRSARQAEALEAYQDARRELAEQLGLEPGEELRRLERAILKQDPAIDAPLQALGDGAAGPGQVAPASGPPSSVSATLRALLLVPWALERIGPLLALAEPLAASQPPREIVIASVVPAEQLSAATAALAERRDALLARGLTARTAAFSSPTPGHDVLRFAADHDVELLVSEAGAAPLEGEPGVLLEHAACDVALIVEAGGRIQAGPIVVPFGAAWHDWAALSLGASVARATGAPLRLIGAAADTHNEGRDASRLLADASLIVQRSSGVVAEPLLGRSGREGVMALAEGAGLLVVALSERWRDEGLGRLRERLVEAPPAPTVFVRRSARAKGLAPAKERTRFGWSLTGGEP